MTERIDADRINSFLAKKREEDGLTKRQWLDQRVAEDADSEGEILYWPMLTTHTIIEAYTRRNDVPSYDASHVSRAITRGVVSGLYICAIEYYNGNDGSRNDESFIEGAKYLNNITSDIEYKLTEQNNIESMSEYVDILLRRFQPEGLEEYFRENIYEYTDEPLEHELFMIGTLVPGAIYTLGTDINREKEIANLNELFEL